MDSVYIFKDILTPEVLAQFQEMVAKAPFKDGRSTASGAAARVKNNEQVQLEEVEGLLDAFSEHVTRNRSMVSVAMPRAFSGMMLSRYGVGMEYGSHTDAAVLSSGHRSDISFTLFLSSPEDYEGGELVLETTFGERRVRLNAGSLILYPTGLVHRVEKVTRGARVVIVGWVQSRIRDSRKRKTILDLLRVREQYISKAGNDEHAQLLLSTIENLRRLWDD